jgi:hypothetical protein
MKAANRIESWKVKKSKKSNCQPKVEMSPVNKAKKAAAKKQQAKKASKKASKKAT